MRRLILLALIVGAGLATAFFPAVPSANANPLTGITALSTGAAHTCALTTAGGVKCWGWNGSGELGNGSSTGLELCYGSIPCSSTPVDVFGMTSGAVAIAAGYHHTCVLTTAGGVKCWGWNGLGQLGNGSSAGPEVCYDGSFHDCSRTPVDVFGLTSGVAAISAGDEYTCALTTAGGVKCWGDNQLGQISSRTCWSNHACSTTPVDISGLTSGVAAISAASQHICALTNSGGVKCLGYNQYGQLGNGTATDSFMPVDVTGMTSGVSAISAGYWHTCALTNSGGVKCWGDNDTGHLGNGTYTGPETCTFGYQCSTTPIDVSGLTGGVSAISAGYWNTCALTTAGGVKCWGDNQYGWLGSGSSTGPETCGSIYDPCSTIPINVFGLTSGAAAVSVNGYACALTVGGNVKCWGGNAFGALGNGTTTGPEQCDGNPCSTFPVDVVLAGKDQAGDLHVYTAYKPYDSSVEAGVKVQITPVTVIESPGDLTYSATVTSSLVGPADCSISPPSHETVLDVWTFETVEDTYSVTCSQPGTKELTFHTEVTPKGFTDPDMSDNQSTAVLTLSVPFRYIALGDSVPYGHGLVNPQTNDGPSSLAYPSIIARDLGLSMRLRSRGCLLSLDNLAVSGATSSSRTALAKDVDCPDRVVGHRLVSTKPHKAVNPEELNAANFGYAPSLITVQVGADNIDFAFCLRKAIGDPRLAFGRVCATNDHRGRITLNATTKRQLDALTASLDGPNGILSKIQNAAPNARIAVLNYYQIIPDPSDIGSSDGSLLCLILSHKDSELKQYLRDEAVFLQQALNEAIAKAVRNHPGVILVDISHLFDGKEMCTNDSDVFTDPDWAIAHPNVEGQEQIARAVESALSSH